jgi:hypothetical protein
MIFVGSKTIEKVRIFKGVSTLHMMNYPGIQHDIAETNGISSSAAIPFSII